MSTTPEPEYRLPLPSPTQAKFLAEEIEGAIPPLVITSLADLATANASGDAATIEAAVSAAVGHFAFQRDHGETTETDGDRFTIYDAYFALNRLPAGAPTSRILEALTVALAVVMKDAAKAEAEKRGVTTIEFGLLRQSLAVVIEVLSETKSNVQ